MTLGSIREFRILCVRLPKNDVIGKTIRPGIENLKLCLPKTALDLSRKIRRFFGALTELDAAFATR